MLESNGKKSLSGNGEDSIAKGGVKLHFHGYQYFRYEKELARREVKVISGETKMTETPKFFRITENADPRILQRLTYIAEVETPKKRFPTTQFQLEQSHRASSGAGKRQATRYSVHGLHEYKGRFNPQVARFLLNYLGATQKSKILDPFCGSGTTLIEAALRGCVGAGIDMNPLAVFICNAKLRALAIPIADMQREFTEILAVAQAQRNLARGNEAGNQARDEYLRKWFPLETLNIIERLMETIQSHSPIAAPVFLSLASNLLREYSLQEPSDLRIRRRTSPLPATPFLEAFKARSFSFLQNLGAAQNVTGLLEIASKATLGDVRELAKSNDGFQGTTPYDFVITSPPYATALPYIDTQRLSLVWLRLCEPDDIRTLEADAIGSREIQRNLETWNVRLMANADLLPASAANYCKKLYEALGVTDGFRRQAVPAALYRYFADTKRAFLALKQILRKNALLGFVIGTNHTTLGGHRFNINTPHWWSVIAEDTGFRNREVIALQTYQRYALHQKNSINGEKLTIFEAL